MRIYLPHKGSHNQFSSYSSVSTFNSDSVIVTTFTSAFISAWRFRWLTSTPFARTFLHLQATELCLEQHWLHLFTFHPCPWGDATLILINCFFVCLGSIHWKIYSLYMFVINDILHEDLILQTSLNLKLDVSIALKKPYLPHRRIEPFFL